MDTRGVQKEPDLIRFGRMVKARRDVLGLTQEEVSTLGGPSDTTFTKIENLEWRPGRAATLKKLDAGLKWEAGSSARILYEGGDPAEIGAVPNDGHKSAELAIEFAVRLEIGLHELTEALSAVGGMPAQAKTALAELDAAAYLAENLALRLAGPELTQKRRAIRARVSAQRGTRPAPTEIPYLPDGSLDPMYTRGYQLSDAELADVTYDDRPGG